MFVQRDQTVMVRGDAKWAGLIYPQNLQFLTAAVHCAGIQTVKGYKRADFVGICGFASVDWVTADFANTYSGRAHHGSAL